MKHHGASVADATSSIFLRHLATITLGVFAALVAVGPLGTRLGPLLHQERLTNIVLGFEWIVIAASSLWLAKTRPVYLLVIWSLLLAIIAHSFCNLYWPSLKPGVPVQDYLLADQVSSNYSFDQAKIYWRHMAIVLLASTAAASAYAAVGTKKQRWFQWFIGSILVIAVAVVAIQSYCNMRFLSEGSGSAMGNRRAPGLLEDSGASTVYYAAMVSGMLYLGLFGPLRNKTKLLWVSAAFFSAFFAIGTGGRILFVSITLSGLAGLCLVTVGHLLRLHSKRSLWVPLATLSACVLLISAGIRSSKPLRHTWSTLSPPNSYSWPGLTNWLTDLCLRVDPIRTVHMRVMLRTISKHPWFGTGLGSFYSNFFENLSWAASTGGVKYADPPSSLYLMLTSELGLAGGIIIVTGAFLLTNAMLSMLRIPSDICQPAKSNALWHCAGLGILISLSISFMIGAHLMFLSVSSLLSMGIFAVAIHESRKTIKQRSILRCILICSTLLLTQCLILAISAPRVPEFRWRERGTPQTPLGLLLPISTHGLTGTWIASGGEVLYKGLPVTIYVEMPPEYYPLSVTSTFVGPTGVKLETKEFTLDHYDLNQPWKSINLYLAEPNACSNNVGPNNFCSIRVETSPVWRWLGQKVGFYIRD